MQWPLMLHFILNGTPLLYVVGYVPDYRPYLHAMQPYLYDTFLSVTHRFRDSAFGECPQQTALYSWARIAITSLESCS